ncbi:MAG TPA: hypothetical protein DD381_10750 [Lentisphaeria bacterium]|nr:MAG: hypothetical protein A2X47_01930 [Lentisphaerae bacterium GWF2_38_69]HBM16805.1 hypothetical protein [Lentisphaeria bacterium]
MKYRIYSPKDYKLKPWRNGKGITTELLRKDIPGTDKFMWRISSAPVTEDGEFSDFSGYDRILVLLEGNGIELSHSDGKTDILKSPFECALFSGDLKTYARLTDGPIRDFNVITNRSYCSAKMDIFKHFQSHELEIDSGVFLVYAVNDEITLQCNRGSKIYLRGKQLLRAENKSRANWLIAGNSIICIRISANKI